MVKEEPLEIPVEVKIEVDDTEYKYDPPSFSPNVLSEGIVKSENVETNVNYVEIEIKPDPNLPYNEIEDVSVDPLALHSDSVKSEGDGSTPCASRSIKKPLKKVKKSQGPLSSSSTVTLHSCTQCDDKFSDILLLVDHQHRIHGVTPVNSEEETVGEPEKLLFRGKWEYKRVWRRRTPNTPVYDMYICFCGRESGSRDSIIHHIWTDHCFKSLAMVCHGCGKLFADEETVLSHDCKRSKYNVDELGDGKFVFNQKWAFELSKIVVDGEEIDHYICGTCGCFVRMFYSMCDHINKVHCQGPILCDRCKRSFKTEALREEHNCIKLQNWIVSNRKPLVDCGDGKTFIFDDKWKCHLEGHYFVCDTCNVKKKVKELIKRHIVLIHANPSRYSCTTCGTSFNLLWKYKKHKCS